MIVANTLFPAPTPHPERAAVLGEVHARPFHPVPTPARLLHFAFMTDAREAAAARAALGDFCREHGLHGPEAGAKHFRVTLGGQSLRFEQHSEFTTYTLEQGGEAPAPFTPAANGVPSVFARLPQPGHHLVSVDLHLMAPSGAPEIDEGLFDPASLAAASVIGGRALVACDFLPVNGFVRILVLDLGLDPASAGALAVRLLEIETYRVLALLGLPEAQRLAPAVGDAETALASISSAMASGGGLDQDNALLERLTGLAAKAEAEATRAAFRFGASRAYDSIVTQRLAAIGEQPTGMRQTLSAFLSRRLQPAMRTCHMLQERQADLSVKLARAANLLRTRVDIELEQQSQELLNSMNGNARAQLAMQETVEGLSVAAVSYYVVGLLGYVFKASKEAHVVNVDPAILSGVSVPLVVLVAFFVVRRIRLTHRRRGGHHP
jgi:uncharacterized membrane-anchored protein